MLEESRDAAVAGEEQLVSCAAEQSKYCSICTVALALAAIVFHELGSLAVSLRRRWRRFEQLYAVCGCGKECRCGPYRGETCSNMLEAMARIAP